MRSVLFGVVLVVAACGGKQSSARPLDNTAASSPPPAAPAPVTPATPKSLLVTMQEFSDAMCKCVDKPCANKIAEGMTRWGLDYAKQNDGETRVSEADTKQINVIVDVMTKCMTKAMLAGSQGDAAGSAAP